MFWGISDGSKYIYLQQQSNKTHFWQSTITVYAAHHFSCLCSIMSFLQMKSTADGTQDKLTDCLTIHPLQPSLSPLARIDSNLNSSPGASHESYSGTVCLSVGSLHENVQYEDYRRCSSMYPPQPYAHNRFIRGGQPWSVCHPCSSAAPQGPDSSNNPHLALMCSLQDDYRYRGFLWLFGIKSTE